jgi:hypothetical protein
VLVALLLQLVCPVFWLHTFVHMLCAFALSSLQSVFLLPEFTGTNTQLHTLPPVLRLRGGAGSDEETGNVSAQAGQVPVQVGQASAQPSAPVTHVSAPSASIAAPLDLVGKALAKSIKPPASTEWQDDEPDLYCEAMDRYVSVCGLPHDTLRLLQLIWIVLPVTVRTAITKHDASLAYTPQTAAWRGLDAFASWDDIRTAILAHYRPIAQNKHLSQLRKLRVIRGKARVFKERFLQHLACLDVHHRPSDMALLHMLQKAMYPKLASMPNILMHDGKRKWQPEAWQQLLDAIVDADDAVAEHPDGSSGGDDQGPSGGSSGGSSDKRQSGGGANKPSGSKRTAGGHQQHRAAKKGKTSGGSPGGDPGAGPSTHAIDAAPGKGKKMQFSDIVWENKQVAAWATKGACIKCGSMEHFARACKVNRPASWFARKAKNAQGK